jgi:hypothetical protein
MQTVQIQTVVRLHELLNVRIFVSLYLSAWETFGAKAVKGSITLTVHDIGRMTEYHLTALLVKVNILLFAFHTLSTSALIQS